MNRSHVILVAVAVAAIAAVLLLRKPGQTEMQSRLITATNASTHSKLPPPALKTVAAPEKTPDVYFLSEAGSDQQKKATVSVRPPRSNGNRRIGSSRAITSADEGQFLAPRWSPDGLELMFTKPGYSGLFTRGINGGDIVQVTGKENVAFGAEWTEEGAIETRTNNGDKQAFNPDGSPVDSVTASDDSSRTGTFTKDDTVYYRANPGEAAVPLTTGDDRYYGGVVSPDGKYVVYNGLHTGLHVAPLDGSSPPVSLGPGEHPSFLPDGSGIVYSITEDDGHNLVAGDLYQASLDGSVISNLTQTPGVIEQKPAVSSDGSQVAFEADGRIYVGGFQ